MAKKTNLNKTVEQQARKSQKGRSSKQKKFVVDSTTAMRRDMEIEQALEKREFGKGNTDAVIKNLGVEDDTAANVKKTTIYNMSESAKLRKSEIRMRESGSVPNIYKRDVFNKEDRVFVRGKGTAPMKQYYRDQEKKKKEKEEQNERDYYKRYRRGNSVNLGWLSDVLYSSGNRMTSYMNIRETGVAQGYTKVALYLSPVLGAINAAGQKALYKQALDELKDITGGNALFGKGQKQSDEALNTINKYFGFDHFDTRNMTEAAQRLDGKLVLDGRTFTGKELVELARSKPERLKAYDQRIMRQTKELERLVNTGLDKLSPKELQDFVKSANRVLPTKITTDELLHMSRAEQMKLVRSMNHNLLTGRDRELIKLIANSEEASKRYKKFRKSKGKGLVGSVKNIFFVESGLNSTDTMQGMQMEAKVVGYSMQAVRAATMVERQTARLAAKGALGIANTNVRVVSHFADGGQSYKALKDFEKMVGDGVASVPAFKEAGLRQFRGIIRESGKSLLLNNPAARLGQKLAAAAKLKGQSFLLKHDKIGKAFNFAGKGFKFATKGLGILDGIKNGILRFLGRIFDFVGAIKKYLIVGFAGFILVIILLNLLISAVSFMTQSIMGAFSVSGKESSEVKIIRNASELTIDMAKGWQQGIAKIVSNKKNTHAVVDSDEDSKDSFRNIWVDNGSCLTDGLVNGLSQTNGKYILTGGTDLYDIIKTNNYPSNADEVTQRRAEIKAFGFAGEQHFKLDYMAGTVDRENGWSGTGGDGDSVESPEAAGEGNGTPIGAVNYSGVSVFYYNQNYPSVQDEIVGEEADATGGNPYNGNDDSGGQRYINTGEDGYLWCYRSATGLNRVPGNSEELNPSLETCLEDVKSYSKSPNLSGYYNNYHEILSMATVWVNQMFDAKNNNIQKNISLGNFTIADQPILTYKKNDTGGKEEVKVDSLFEKYIGILWDRTHITKGIVSPIYQCVTGNKDTDPRYAYVKNALTEELQKTDPDAEYDPECIENHFQDGSVIKSYGCQEITFYCDHRFYNSAVKTPRAGANKEGFYDKYLAAKKNGWVLGRMPNVGQNNISNRTDIVDKPYPQLDELIMKCKGNGTGEEEDSSSGCVCRKVIEYWEDSNHNGVKDDGEMKHKRLPCPGHTFHYCPGHTDLNILVKIMKFDEAGYDLETVEVEKDSSGERLRDTYQTKVTTSNGGKANNIFAADIPLTSQAVPVDAPRDRYWGLYSDGREEPVNHNCTSNGPGNSTNYRLCVWKTDLPGNKYFGLANDPLTDPNDPDKNYNFTDHNKYAGSNQERVLLDYKDWINGTNGASLNPFNSSFRNSKYWDTADGKREQKIQKNSWTDMNMGQAYNIYTLGWKSVYSTDENATEEDDLYTYMKLDLAEQDEDIVGSISIDQDQMDDYLRRAEEHIGEGTPGGQDLRNIIEIAMEATNHDPPISYSWGGAGSQPGYNASGKVNAGNGLDCSGFVSWVYWTAGFDEFKAPKRTANFLGTSWGSGHEVAGGIANARPGDIICHGEAGWKDGSKHCMIFYGFGQIGNWTDSFDGKVITILHCSGDGPKMSNRYINDNHYHVYRFADGENAASLGPPTSTDDLDCLARIINAEAGGCDNLTMEYVGCVAYNRMRNNTHPSFAGLNSIYDVVSAPGQYSTFNNARYNSPPSEAAIRAAKKVLSGAGGLNEWKGQAYAYVWQANSTGNFGKYDPESVITRTKYGCKFAALPPS